MKARLKFTKADIVPILGWALIATAVKPFIGWWTYPLLIGMAIVNATR